MSEQAEYEATVGFNYPHPSGKGEVRVEEGELCSPPDAVAKTLLDIGAVKRAAKRKTREA